MDRKLIAAIIIVACVGAVAGGVFWYRALKAKATQAQTLEEPQPILVNPDDVRGVYMTASVARGVGPPAGGGGNSKRDAVVKLLDETELNGIVIDVKEANGSEVTKGLKEFVASLQEKPVWKIARIVMFTDNSQVAEHPDWYLTNTNGAVWRDNRGNAWLDPANPDALQYLTDFAKSIIDIGFDELQFDYIRYPSDGAVGAIRATGSKRKTISAVFKQLSDELRAHKPDIRLSVDLFGYVTQRPELSIGQALEDAVPHMDYISPMIYPSHYYSGFSVKADKKRELPAVSLSAAGTHDDPDTVMYRSLLTAQDTINTVSTTRRAKLRPWLQDFTMGGVRYDKEKVRAQIDAAKRADASGWLLWNAGNRYTKSALEQD